MLREGQAVVLREGQAVVLREGLAVVLRSFCLLLPIELILILN